MAIQFKDLRQKMVDCQLRTVDIADLSILRAFLSVEREKFVPHGKEEYAYLDQDILLKVDVKGESRYMLCPASLAKLLQLLTIKRGDVVLVIGAALGYSSAILSHLSDSVIALEEDTDLFEQTNKNLAENYYDNVALMQGSLIEGYQEAGPYDAILIEGRVECLPEQILRQLKEGGRLACIEGTENLGMAKLYQKEKGCVSSKVKFHLPAKSLKKFKKAQEFVF